MLDLMRLAFGKWFRRLLFGDGAIMYPDVLQQIQARAWMDGYDAGYADGYGAYADDWQPGTVPAVDNLIGPWYDDTRKEV